jgi:hypothetical protein
LNSSIVSGSVSNITLYSMVKTSFLQFDKAEQANYISCANRRSTDSRSSLNGLLRISFTVIR